MISKSKIRNFFRFTVFVIVFFIVGKTVVVAQSGANTIELNYDFHHGTSDWTAGFADYPASTDPNGSLYELFAGSRYMPRKLTRVPKPGFYIQGHNRSDDLFMYLKRRLRVEDGIVAGQTYQIQFVITLASNAPTGCAGIGGAPGEGVVLKAGATSVEPLSVLQPNGYLRMK
jgi:hypothetical protein